MKQTAVGIVGLVFGLLLTWICLYAFSRIEWLQSNRIITGCHELGKCAVPWWAVVEVFVYILGPSFLFGLLNVIAWKRWSVKKWAVYFVAATLGIIGLYLSGYASL